MHAVDSAFVGRLGSHPAEKRPPAARLQAHRVPASPSRKRSTGIVPNLRANPTVWKETLHRYQHAALLLHRLQMRPTSSRCAGTLCNSHLRSSPAARHGHLSAMPTASRIANIQSVTPVPCYTHLNDRMQVCMSRQYCLSGSDMWTAQHAINAWSRAKQEPAVAECWKSWSGLQACQTSAT